MLIADAWSCAYLNEHTKDQPEEELEVNCITTQLPVSEKKLKIAEKKKQLKILKCKCQKGHIMKGWPAEKGSVHKYVQKYWTFKDEISYTSGLLFKAAKLIIPSK